MSYLSQSHYCCKSNSKPATSFSVVIKGIKTFSRFRGVFLMLSFLWIGIIQANAQQIAVTVTGNTNTTPNLSASYTTLADALTGLNAVNAMTGPVTFTLAAGTTETAPIKGFTIGSATLNPVLSASNTVTIVKASGSATTVVAGAGTATPSSASPDGMLKITGADYITIDGLTFTDGNSTNPATMEFGIALFKLSGTDGARNNTIRNCIFNMKRVNNAAGSGPMVEGAVAINVVNALSTTATTAITPTNASGSNSNNKFYSNTINGGNYGIALNGFAATSGVGPNPNAATFLGDLGNDIGGNISTNGNSILNFGGGGATSPAAGIRAVNQWGINVSYNTINNNNGSGVNHTTTLRGIYTQSGTSANANILFNNITLISDATTTGSAAIENAIGSTSASNTVNINNNTIEIDQFLATTGVCNGIINSATATTVNINNNSISGIGGWDVVQLGGTGTHVIIETGSPVNANTNGNTIASFGRNGLSGNWRIIKTTNPTNWTCNNNTIQDCYWMNLNSTGNIDAIYSLSSAVNVTITNNIIRLLATPRNGTLNGIREWGVAGNKIIQNNTISGFFSYPQNNGAVGGLNANGIYCSIGTIDISNNIVTNLSGGGAFPTYPVGGIINGILLDGGTVSNVYRNKITGLSSRSTNPTVSGITLSGGNTHNLSNNIIGSFSASNANNAPNVVIGVNITGSTTANLYFNTVYIDLFSSGANYGSSALSTNITTNLLLQNNIFVNKTTNYLGTGLNMAFRRNGTSLTSYQAASNNNLFYVLPTEATSYIFGDGTNNDKTLSAYKTRVASRDNSSISELPQFLSLSSDNANYLHINTTIPTQIESGGIPVSGISVDFDGNTRNVSTPDIGADEFSGIIADLTGPSIINPTFPNTCGGGARTLSVTITDASGVPASGTGLPVVYWSINNPSGPFTPAQMTHAGGNIYQCTTIGTGSVEGDIIYYYIVAQDNVGTPNLNVSPSTGASGLTANPPAAGTAPAVPFSYTNQATLSGTYTVGTGGNYTTLTAAVADYNTKCLAGNVIFELTTTYYNTSTGEVFPIVINQNPTAGPTKTLTIRPAAGAEVLMVASSGASASSLIKLNGADYVTIDGNNTVDADQKFLIYNTATVAGHAGVWISSLGAGQGATNNTIKNCQINTGISQNTSSVSSYGIVMSGTTLSGTHGSVSSGADNDNNTFSGNFILRARYGIYSIGASAVNPNTGTVISANTFGSEVLNTGFQIGKAAIVVREEDGIQITNNDIRNVGGSYANTPTSGTDRVGIAFATDGDWPGTAVYVKNAVVTGNKIHQVVEERTFSAAAITHAASDGVNPTNNIIANNFIYDVKANGTSPDQTIGIGLTAGNGDKVVFNSIYMTGDTDPNVSAATPDISSFGISINSASVSNPQIRNNIIYMDLSSSSAPTLKHAAINVPSGYSWGTGNSNYNDLYINPSNTQSNIGCVGGSGGTFYSTFGAWQSAVSQDANSVNILPAFTSATDLHLGFVNNLALDNLGTAVSGVTTDIDGDVRSLVTPDIGADEFTTITCTTAIGGTANGSASFCNAGTPAITATGYSIGINSSYQWYSSNNVNNYPNAGSIVSGQTNPASLTTGVVSQTTYYWLKVSCATNTSTDYSNMITVTVNPSLAGISGASAKCADDPAVTLTENGGTGTSWLWSPGGETTQSISVNPGSTTVYSVQVTSPGGCTANTSKTLTINLNPTGVTANASATTVCSGEPFNLTSTFNAPPTSVLSQDFESGIGPWTITAASTGGTNNSLANFNIRAHGWLGGDPATTAFNSPGGSSFILADPDGAKNTPALTLNTQLTSPSFSLVGYTTASLAFRHYYRHVTTNQTVQVSLNGGIWTTIQTFSADAGTAAAFTPTSISLTPYAGNADVRIRFNYTGGWLYYWAIDDIAITGTPTPYTFSWSSSPNGFSSTVQNPTSVTQTASRDYTVIVTGEAGCTATASTGTVAVSTNTITASSGPGGTITPAGETTVNCGTNNTEYTITPDACYSITDVLVNGSSVGAVGSYTFTNVTTNQTIAASFTLNTNTITASAGTGGTISPSGITTVDCGNNVTVYTITPDACYSITDVLVDGVSQGATGTYTFTDITTDHTIDAVFSLNTYSIISSAGTGGSISFNINRLNNGDTEETNVNDPGNLFNCGASVTFTITPDPCFTIEDVIVDGISQGAIGSYTFTNVQAAHSISATFLLNTFTITVTAGSNGSITPGTGSANCGDDATYTITADPGYVISDVIVDGVSQGATGSYTFTNVQAAHSISASFVPDGFTINATAGIGGTISPNGNTSVNAGGNQSYTITADPCYSISDVVVDGISQGAIPAYTFTNVQQSHTITASFTQNGPYTITVTAGANGSITPGSGAVACGSNATYTITPASCYSIASLIVDGSPASLTTGSLSAGGTYVFTDVQAPHSISAAFALNDPFPTPGPLTGIINVCQYVGTGTPLTYSVPADPNATAGYQWVVPPTVTIVSGQGTNSIVITANNGFIALANKQLRVTALSSCGNSPQAVFFLHAQLPTTPSPIVASTANICPNIGTNLPVTYTIPRVTDASSYIWTAQAGTTTITSINGPGVNDTAVTVTFSSGFTTSAITVRAVNDCGTTNPRSFTITRNNPGIPALISGPTNACPFIAPNGTPATYSVAPVANATGYNWTVPAGSTGLTGQGTNSISFIYPAGFTSGTVTVTASNGCGVSATRSLSVGTLNPATPGMIDVQNLATCPNRQYSYTIATMPANAQSVQWTAPAGATIVSGQGTTSIVVSYPGTAVNGNVTATAVNNCGSSVVRFTAVKLPACPPVEPPPPFAGNNNPLFKGNVAAAAEAMNVNVYPNPTTTDFKLQVLTAGKEEISVRVLDMTGRFIKQVTVMPYQTINIGAELKAGSYMIEVRQGSSLKTTRVMKF